MDNSSNSIKLLAACHAFLPGPLTRLACHHYILVSPCLHFVKNLEHQIISELCILDVVEHNS